ncbi:MAG: hypothetical protein FJ265_03010 [Planctomycetes bacterium]|nr:hypothetical protein [Planctomycetota bacterium]
MFALLLCTGLLLAPQQPAPVHEAVAVRGEAELSQAAAFASAAQRAEAHVRDRWRERAERVIDGQRPFWLPSLLAQEAVRRYLADLPADRLVRYVDRDDRERQHEFGSSWQTTLWVAESPQAVQQQERQLRRELRQLEQTTAIKYGGVVAGWAVLALAIGWFDRLSRGYMTGRLRLLGLLCGAAFPAVAFLL